VAGRRVGVSLPDVALGLCRFGSDEEGCLEIRGLGRWIGSTLETSLKFIQGLLGTRKRKQRNEKNTGNKDI